MDRGRRGPGHLANGPCGVRHEDRALELSAAHEVPRRPVSARAVAAKKTAVLCATYRNIRKQYQVKF